MIETLKALVNLYTEPAYKGLGIRPGTRITNVSNLLFLAIATEADFEMWKALAWALVNRAYHKDYQEIAFTETVQYLKWEHGRGLSYDDLLMKHNIEYATIEAHMFKVSV